MSELWGLRTGDHTECSLTLFEDLQTVRIRRPAAFLAHTPPPHYRYSSLLPSMQCCCWLMSRSVRSDKDHCAPEKIKSSRIGFSCYFQVTVIHYRAHFIFYAHNMCDFLSLWTRQKKEKKSPYICLLFTILFLKLCFGKQAWWRLKIYLCVFWTDTTSVPELLSPQVSLPSLAVFIFLLKNLANWKRW